MYDKNNIFAKILAGTVPCKKIYEDKHCLAFYDIAPKAKLHAIIIPKYPYIDFGDFIKNAANDYIGYFFKSFQKVIKKLEIEGKGYKITSHKGKTGGQEVFHLHFHILCND